MPPETLDQLIQEQLGKWKLASEEKRGAPKTVISISREPGCNGAGIAKKLAGEFKLDLYAGKIAEEIAKSTRMTTAVIESLDEKSRSMLDDWLAFFDPAHSLGSLEYLNHLVKIMGTIARHGHAVILGRGGNFLIEAERQLRIRLIGPLELRIINVMNRFGVSRQDAEKRIKQVEEDRKGYSSKYFKLDIADPIHYDLVINIAFMTDEAIIEMARSGLKAKNLI